MSWKQTLHYNQWARIQPSVPEQKAEQARLLAEYQAGAKAREAAAQLEQDRRLEVEGTALFLELGQVVRDVASEQGWVAAAEQIDRLVESGALSSRHGTDLRARLMRIARERGWVGTESA
jgi:hypothetical protein